jgi:hypothetical protein
MKRLERFKRLKTQDLELEDGLIVSIDRKIGYFMVVSQNTVYKIGLHSNWYMAMDFVLPENTGYQNPKGVIV